MLTCAASKDDMSILLLQFGGPFGWYWLPPGNPLFTLWLPLAAFGLAILAQVRVQSAFRRFSRVPTRSGLSGSEVADLLLRSRGIADVKVEPTTGFLGDHYDPTTKTLRLSEGVYGGRSVASLGIAAHETGHALQHADAYAWLTMRSRIVRVVSICSRVGMYLLPIGIGIAYFSRSSFGITLLYGAAVALAGLVVFSLITLPVEIDASQRAMKLLGNAGVLVGDEVDGARTVLKAAAWTYVAAAAAAIVELLRVLAIISSLSGRNRSSN
jgi:Zn-dependent membrane protease YugP